MSTAVMLTTCGRRHYLERSMESLLANLPVVKHRIMVDDSGDSEFGAWLDESFPSWRIIHHASRCGLAAAVESAWAEVRRTDASWVFHTEDDFTYEQPIPLGVMTTLLATDGTLAQVTLYRQPWSPAERIIDGYLNDGRWSCEWANERHELHVDGGLFSFNPTLYRRSVVDSCRGGLEADVTAQLAGSRFGVLSGPGKRPLCWHIGAERSAGW